MRSAETVLGLLRDRGKRGLPLERVYRRCSTAAYTCLRTGRSLETKERSHRARRRRPPME